MQIIQDIFNKIIAEQFTPEKMAVKVIENCLEKKGIKLTKEQIEKLKNELIKNGINNLSISIDDSQVPAEHFQGKEKSSNISIDISGAEVDIEKLAKQFIDKISDDIPAMVSEVGEIITYTLHKNSKKMLKNRRSDIQKYESAIFNKWEKAIDLLETTLVIATEIGEDFNKELREKPIPDRGYMIEVMTRLHARACQVASEILTLLKSGYADGAHARWRCLYEIVVVLHFIGSFGEETARKYILHQGIESYKAALLYQDNCERLGYEPMTDEEIDKLKDNREKLIIQFGKNYSGDYGWATIETGVKQPTFRDIEKKIEMAHMRPFYKMASHNVHANPKGVLFKLGLLPIEPEILLAGPSIIGLDEPGQGTAISILQATTALLAIEANIDRLVSCDILKRFSKETMNAFVKVQETINDEIKLTEPKKRELKKNKD